MTKSSLKTNKYQVINKFKTVFLVLVNLMLFQAICSQSPKNMTDYLKQRFISYCKSVPREEIFIHTDREDYISGEYLWFNVYLIDRQSFNPSLNSRIVYFELLNTENRPLIQKRVLIDKGSGPSQIILPDTLSTGIYRIRAYTSWMKNFLPDNCFVKDIKVYNALSGKGLIGKTGNGSLKEEGIRGSRNQGYKKSGVTLTINDSRQDILEINVGAEDKFRKDNENTFYLFIQTHGNINLASAEKLTGRNTVIEVSKTLLNPGINQVTIFNSRGEAVSEKYIYTPEKVTNSIILHSADTCGLRSKILLEIQPGDGISSFANLTNLSISVAPKISDLNLTDLNDYMVFGSEYGMPNKISLISRNLKNLSKPSMDSILLNLKSNWINWTAIQSGAVPDFKYQAEKTDHHVSGRFMSNDLKTSVNGENLFLCTPGKQASFQYARTDSSGNFNFQVHIDEAIKDLIIMPEYINEKHKIIIESSFSDHYLQSGLPVESASKDISPQISKMSINQQVQTIFGINASAGPLNPVYKPPEPIRFYGKPDIELKLADYISLPVMGEIFFELLPGVSMKQKKSMYEITLSEHIGDRLIVSSPATMIDGVVLKDASLIANLDPEIVEKIDVIKGKYQVGKYVFYGIVNVITKAGDFNSVPLPDYMIRMPYRVIDPVLSFISPDYTSADTRESRIPDYRNTLYWNPSVRPGKDGNIKVEFWSSDNKSDYLINIQGTTQDGKMLSVSKSIKVR